MFLQYKKNRGSEFIKLDLKNLLDGVKIPKTKIKSEFLDEDFCQVRQLSVSTEMAVITYHLGDDESSSYAIELYDLQQNKSLAKLKGYNSAVFNDINGEYIIAAKQGCQEQI